MTEQKLTDEQVIDQVKKLTGAADAAILSHVTDWCYSVRVAFHDGPDAYTFQTRLVDVEAPELRLIGFNW
jgi:hypothetical protein